MSKSIAIVNASATFSTSQAKDSLDVALIFGSYEVETHLFFIGDGVWQLMPEQSPESINTKNIFKTFNAFEFYDLENVYVCEQSLADRNIVTTEFNIDNIVVLSPQEIAAKLKQHNTVFTF